jgi:hypothetical protein
VTDTIMLVIVIYMIFALALGVLIGKYIRWHNRSDDD